MRMNSIILFFHTFCTKNGIVSRFSCPHTSSQNGKSERKSRSINNIICTLLCHASLPFTFWPYALNTTTIFIIFYLLNFLGILLQHIFCFAKLHLILIFGFLDVYAFLLYPTLKLINFNLILLLVFSWVILRLIKVTNAMILLLTKLFSLGMLFF